MVMRNFFFYFAALIEIKGKKTQPKNYFIFKNP